MADVNTRPNIRIEIKNNVTNESMDVDEEAINISEDEEGEIVDNNDKEEDSAPKNNVVKSRDIWAKFDNGTKSINSDVKTHIESVYSSLNVKELHDTVRLDAVHMRGIGEMNTLDILKYFLAFSPTAIEWVDDTSCNILWADMPMAAKALYHLSKAIVGSKDDGMLEETMDLDGLNNGMQNKHRIIEIKDEDKVIDKETDKENSKEIHIRDIKQDIPDDGKWRLGNESIKSTFILLRFVLTTDKQPIRAEHFTEYYKQCGVIENGNKLGIISKSRKRKFLGIFDRNRDLTSREDSAASKNPWGPLAESWYQDYDHIEAEYKPSNLLTSKRLESVSNLQHRLGFKRAHLELDEVNTMNIKGAPDELELVAEEVIEIRSDIEDTIASEEHTSRLLLEKRLKHKSSKKSMVPRMRMYADEEEAKIKRKKSLQSLKKKLSSQKKKVVVEVSEEVVEANDLRNMLGKRTILKPKRRMENRLENVVLVVKQEPQEFAGNRMEDLGNKLKHRHMARLGEAAAKNSVHLRVEDIHHRVSTSYQDDETYQVQEPELGPLRRPTSPTTTMRTKSKITSSSTTSIRIPPGGTLHSDTITMSARRSEHTMEQQNHSPDRHHHGDRSGKDGRNQRHQRDGRSTYRERNSRYESSGRMHADREEFYDRRGGGGGKRTYDRQSVTKKYRMDVEDEEMESLERKGAKSKVMVVVKKHRQPTVASMAILPPPSSSSAVSQQQHLARPMSISTSTLRHRQHDNARLATRDRPSSSSSSSSSEDDDDDNSSSSTSSSSSSDDDDSSSELGSDSDSSDSSASDRKDKTLVKSGGRATVNDRVGIRREEAQEHGRLRVQIKNEHYGM